MTRIKPPFIQQFIAYEPPLRVLACSTLGPLRPGESISTAKIATGVALKWL